MMNDDINWSYWILLNPPADGSMTSQAHEAKEKGLYDAAPRRFCFFGARK